MINIFYTGAPAFLAPQTDRDQSLGGFISSTQVPNDFMGNLFGGLSQMTINQKKSEVRVIAIQNNTGATITGLKVYFTYPNDGEVIPTDTNLAEFQIGYKNPTPDDCGDLLTELVPNIYATPYTVTFQPAVGIGNALALPDLDHEQYVVLYLKRSIKVSTETEDECYERLLEIFEGDFVPETEEKIQMTLDWN